MNGQDCCAPLTTSPSYHQVVTGTAADNPALLLNGTQGMGVGEGEQRARGGQQPLGELLTVYTIVYSSVIKSASTLFCYLKLFSDSIPNSLNP